MVVPDGRIMNIALILPFRSAFRPRLLPRWWPVAEARSLADVSPSGGRHVLIPFSAPLPWLGLRDVARGAVSALPCCRPGADVQSLGGQISPPGSRHKSGGWRVLSTPLDEARAAVEHPNGPEVWG